MEIIRVQKNRDYTVINNTALRDRKLSLKAKGLFALVMSLPDDWDFTISGIVSIIPDGETLVRTAIKSLIKNGYCAFKRLYENGKISGSEYTFFESQNLRLENLNEGFLNEENQAQLNTDSNEVLSEVSTDSKNNKKEIPDLEKPTNGQKKEKEKTSAQKEKEIPEEIFEEVVNFLSEKTGRRFRVVEPYKKPIRARIKDGYTVEDIKKVIEFMVLKWIKDLKMSIYLRPETLLGNKFHSYFAEAKATVDNKQRINGESDIAYLRRTGAYN